MLGKWIYGNRSMIKKPVLLVTCRIGSEEWCIEEVGNVLYPYDNSVEVTRTKYKGLLITYSKLNSIEAYRLLSTREYGFVKNVIPILASIPFDEDLLFSKVREIVGNVDCVKVKLRVRGVRGLSKRLWLGLMNTLKEHGLKHDPKCYTCLFIEILDKDAYIGLRECSTQCFK